MDVQSQELDMGHELLVLHAGDDVWSVDRFADGLSDVRFLLRDVVTVTR